MQQIQQIDAQIAHCDQEIAVLTEARNILQAQREEAVLRAQEAELPALLARIKELGLSKAQLGFDTKKAKSAVAGPNKYRNPETGEEWSGKGNAPSWMPNDKDQFLNPAWEEHKKKKGGKAKSSELQAQSDQSAKPVATTVQELTSITTAPTTIAVVPAANAAQEQVSEPTPAPTEPIAVAPALAVVVASVSEAPSINQNVATGPAQVGELVDPSTQPVAVAA